MLFLLFIALLVNGSTFGKTDPVLKGIVLFHFIGSPMNDFPEFDIRNERQEKDRPYNTSECMKRLVEPVRLTDA